MQIKVTRRSIASVVTVVVSLMTLLVMYRGIRTGEGVIPGFSFLLWTLIALAYSVHEEITQYVKENHTRVTEPLTANMEALKTNVIESARRDSVQPLHRFWGDAMNRLRLSLLAFLHQLIKALESPEDKPPHNP